MSRQVGALHEEWRAIGGEAQSLERDVPGRRYVLLSPDAEESAHRIASSLRSLQERAIESTAEGVELHRALLPEIRPGVHAYVLGAPTGRAAAVYRLPTGWPERPTAAELDHWFREHFDRDGSWLASGRSRTRLQAGRSPVTGPSRSSAF